jgi:hypothetical protein
MINPPASLRSDRLDTFPGNGGYLPLESVGTFVGIRRILSDNLFRRIARCQIAKNQADRNSSAFDAGLSPKDIGRALDMVFPFNLHLSSSGRASKSVANSRAFSKHRHNLIL